MNKNISTISRLMSFANNTKIYFVLSLFCALVSGILSLLLPYFFGNTVDLIVDKGDVDLDRILRILLICGIIIVINSVITLIMNRLNYKITYNIVENIRNNCYSKLNRLPISYLDSKAGKKVNSFIINDCEVISDGLLLVLNQLFSGLVSLVGTLIVMIYIDYVVALIVFVLTPISVFVSGYIATNIHKYFKAQSEIKNRQTSYINEMVDNYKVVKAFKYNNHVQNEFDIINDEYKKTSTKATFLSSMVNPTTRLINAIIYAIIALTGSHRVISGLITVGNLTSLLAYAQNYMKPINEISGVFAEVSDAITCASIVFDFLDIEETERMDMHTGAVKPIKGDVKLDKVSFSYDGTKNVLDDITLNIGANKTVAIIGPTGCGKTTLINLLMRFYDNSFGTIYIDDSAIGDIDKYSLRSQIGMVPQETWFKTDTIMNNLKYAFDKNEEFSEEKVYEACKIIGCHSFISKLPNGYNEVLSSSNDNISDGQKQLISIARAYLSNPSILILDEATSSVDALTEARISEAVRKLCKDRTSIIIAHRLSTIINSDIIVVLNQGKVVEVGNHKDLIKNNGYYYELYHSYYDQ